MCGGPFVPTQNGPICFVFLIPLAIFYYSYSFVWCLPPPHMVKTPCCHHWVLTALTLAFCLLIAA